MLKSFENCNTFFTVGFRFFHISDTFDSYDDDDDGTADEVERANVLTAPTTVLPEWAEVKMRPSGALPHTLPFSVSVTFFFFFGARCERQDVDFQY